MSSYVYSCNHCSKVLPHDRYHLIGSDDFDVCYYDYSQMDDANRARFHYVLNEHMAGPVGYLDQLDDVGFSSQEEEEEDQAPATEEEDLAEALFGCASQDDRSQDSMSFGSLEDFISDERTVVTEEVLGPIEILDMDTFMSQVTPFPALNDSLTCMENEYGESESDWSETDDEDESEVESALRETHRDRAEAEETMDNHEVIRVPNRAFGKRQVKPRLGNLFTYSVGHIKNGGEEEY